jgi:hypothetical protein
LAGAFLAALRFAGAFFATALRVAFFFAGGIVTTFLWVMYYLIHRSTLRVQEFGGFSSRLT